MHFIIKVAIKVTLGFSLCVLVFDGKKMRVNKSAYSITKVVEDETLQPLRVI